MDGLPAARHLAPGERRTTRWHAARPRPLSAPLQPAGRRSGETRPRACQKSMQTSGLRHHDAERHAPPAEARQAAERPGNIAISPAARGGRRPLMPVVPVVWLTLAASLPPAAARVTSVPPRRRLCPARQRLCPARRASVPPAAAYVPWLVGKSRAKA